MGYHRKKANSRRDKRNFSKTAQRTNIRNIGLKPMRGGIRL